MAVTDGASVTETPWLKRGSVWYASAPFNSPIRGHSTLTPVLGVGATLSACGASPSTRSSRARWGYEAGSPVRKGGVAHCIWCWDSDYTFCSHPLLLFPRCKICRHLGYTTKIRSNASYVVCVSTPS